MSISLSPSELTFLLSDCKRCFYLKNRNIYKRPFMPFPGVFTRIDTSMRKYFATKNTQPYLGKSGKFITKNTSVRSEVFGKNDLYFSGKMDALVAFDDGTYAVIDFKTSSPSDNNLGLYLRQLYAYKESLEKPAAGVPIKISMMGLLIASPDDMFESDQKVGMEMKIRFHRFDEDPDWWENFKASIDKLLSTPLHEVAGKADCPHCRVQNALAMLEQAS